MTSYDKLFKSVSEWMDEHVEEERKNVELQSKKLEATISPWVQVKFNEAAYREYLADRLLDELHDVLHDVTKDS